ncbi:response regulator [Pelomonas sp. V22]|uniref:response regulator n=1 Tax=Pelomonas sp. V22 TaxID=2822139 RepID=UPI0024A90291|nr:response regulator [Pelomonas sp. V22]MDI4632228.1 response regulator [Pelomonas sp. V22]
MAPPASKPISAFRVLMVEDQQQMRQIIRESLYRLGIRQVVMTAHADEALKAMRVGSFDLVLCDYNLGEGADGQQLLEAARGNRLVNPLAPWIYITANSLRADVLAAGDYQPDGYILKPFTDQLLARQIEALAARKQQLAPLLVAMDARDWDKAIAVADEFIQRADATRGEGYKQKAAALMKLARFEDARACYEQALTLNSELAWAQLGQAQALRALGRAPQAEGVLQRLVQGQPDYAAAYDLLLELAEERGDAAAALALAQTLAELAPNAERKIKLGELAQANGDAALAVRALESAVTKNRHALQRSHHEGMLLAQALIDKGEVGRGVQVAQEQGRQFGDLPAARALGNALQAQGLQQLGQADKAAELMAQAQQGGGLTDLPDAHKLLMARSALATGHLELGQELILAVARNNSDQPMMLAAALKSAKGTAVEEACREQVEREGKDVVEALQQLQQAKRGGDLAQAIVVGEAALQRAPHNFSVQIELCTLYLIAMNRLGQAEQHAGRARELLDQLAARHPNHDRVAAARKFFRERVKA